MIYILLLIGVITLNLLRLNEAWKINGFTWGKFLKKNIIASIVTMIAGVVLILNPDVSESYIDKILPGIGFKVNGLTMFMFGITGDVLLKKLIAMFNPNKKTVVGRNKV